MFAHYLIYKNVCALLIIKNLFAHYLMYNYFDLCISSIDKNDVFIRYIVKIEKKCLLAITININ